MTQRIDTERPWGRDAFFFTEAARGGPWLWRVGDPGFAGEPLGPVRHAHDDAAEYYYMFSGSGYVETGGEEFVLEEGQLGYIPPDAPHNFLGPASDEDACFFCVVAPNFAANKWRVKDFLPGSEELRMSVATPFAQSELPGGDTLRATALELTPDSGWHAVKPRGIEVVYLVVDGALQIRIDEGLHGSIPAGTYVHLREMQDHALNADSPCRVLRIDCKFDAWSGVATGDDAREAQPA